MEPRELLPADRLSASTPGERPIQLTPEPASANRPVGVIDIGSNSIRLAVIETDGRNYLEVLEEARAVPKLIRDVSATGMLSDRSIETVLDILRDFLAIARGGGADEVYAVATSAVRDATNGGELVARAASELGLVVEIAPGTREAEFAFTGAVHGLLTERGLVIDIGGGSMEVVRFDGRELIGAWTLPLGAVRLSDDFALSDPPRPKQLDALRDRASRGSELSPRCR
jgi:exopolyphosphatase / guanosine-5'-triphosphate,3'-diphosphate pyrophosphatase